MVTGELVRVIVVIAREVMAGSADVTSTVNVVVATVVDGVG